MTFTIPPHQVNIKVPWSVPSDCTPDKCKANVYRTLGDCTAVSSASWTLVGQTNSSTFIDSTVSANTTYSYVVELFNPKSANSFSGPSNCKTFTTGG